jgi:hypothetical protein
MIKRVVLTTLLFAFAGNVMSAQAQFRPLQNDRFEVGQNVRNNFQSYLNNLQTETRRLKDSIDRDLDRSRSDGSRREDRINQQMKDFKSEVDRLRDRYNDRKPVRDNIFAVTRYRPILDNLMRQPFISSTSRQYWNDLRSDLDRLERLSQGTNSGFYQRDGRYNDNYRW